MPPFELKAAVQGVFSRLPGTNRLNRLAQRLTTGRHTLGRRQLEGKWGQVQRHVRFAEEAGRPVGGLTVLELGTGTFPLVPVGLFLAGAREVCSIDIDQLYTASTVRETLSAYVSAVEDGVVSTGTERLAQLREAVSLAAEPTKALRSLGIHASIADARALTLPSGSLDFVISNNTFEHIPPDDLRRILRELRRVAAPEALGCHFIDMTDHYAHFDARIGVYNYMRYSSARWRLFNNALHYQNRLRLSDYLALHEETGWRVLDAEGERRPDELRGLTLAEDFRHYSTEDLEVCRAWVLSTPA